MNPEKALIRTCDICGKVNAISLNVSDKEKRELNEIDHTVKLVSKTEAMRLWQDAGKCDHKTLFQELREEIEFLKNKLL